MNPILYRRILSSNKKNFPPPPPYVVAASNNHQVNSISGLSYVFGNGPSGESSSFKIIALGLIPSSGNITVTPSINFEVFNGTIWINTSFNIPYTDGKMDTPAIYKVRLASGLTVNSYSGTLTLSGANAPDSNIILNGQVTNSNNLNNGLISWYSLNGNTFDPVNGYDGTPTNLTYSTGTPPVYGLFEGDTYISLPNNFDFKQPIFTVSSKIIATAFGDRLIMQSFNSPPDGLYYGLIIYMIDGVVWASVTDGDTGGVYAKGNITVNNDLEHTIVITYDGTTLSIYVDGVFDNSIVHSLSYQPVNFPVIGAVKYDRGTPTIEGFFIGKMKNIGYWSRVLSTLEINNLQTASYPF